MANNSNYWRGRAAFYARKYGINPQVFMKQIQMESGFDPNAHSGAGAQGIAQIMPFHNVPSDPESQLAWAAQHDAQNLKKYGNWKDALSVYNSGRPWARGSKISETSNYVSKILGGSNPSVPSQGQSSPMVPSPGLSGGTGLDMRKLGALYFLQQASGEGAPQQADLMTLALARQQFGAAQQQFGAPRQMASAPASKSVVTGLNSDFAKRLAAFNHETGTSVRSGYRSVGEQTQLWNAALKKYGSATEARKWVAPPGHSKHNEGMAADISGNLQAAHKLAGKYGLWFPMSWEPWHVEPIGSRG
jgi:hypothetical protein